MAAHRGRVPLDSHLLRVMGVWDFGSFPTDTSFVVDRPPTHFFVKKKFIPIGGAETTTQKVPSVLCYAHDLCGEGIGCYARNPRAAQEVPRRQEGAFFFTKKASCGNQTLCVAESRKSVQTHPHHFSALKKDGIPKGRVPLAGARGQSPRGLPSVTGFPDAIL